MRPVAQTSCQPLPCVRVCYLFFYAGDLPGMRLAADRIVKSLQRLDYADAPVWQAAQQRLLEQLVQQLGLATGGSGGSCGNGSGGSADGGTSGGSSAGVGLQLAVVAEQAAVALPALPLEEEGRMYEATKPKVGAGGCWRCLWHPCRQFSAAGRCCGMMRQLQHSALHDTLSLCLPLAVLLPQVSVARPDNVVDVSDLDPDQPR